MSDDNIVTISAAVLTCHVITYRESRQLVVSGTEQWIILTRHSIRILYQMNNSIYNTTISIIMVGINIE